ncbi:MAG: hypothetical protein ACOYB7_18540, partial [Mycobacterium sp.]
MGARRFPMNGTPTRSGALQRTALLAVHLAVLLVMVIAMPGPLNCLPRMCAHDTDSAHAPDAVAPPPVPVALSMNPGPDALNVDPLAPVTVTATAGSLLTVVM